MHKKRSSKSLMLALLLVVITCTTIGYALLNTTLTIKGNAKINAASWDIHFENIEMSTTENGSFVTEPEILDDQITIETFDVELTAPGDSATIKVDIVNDGTLDAELTDYILGELTFANAGTANDANDATLVENNVTYTLVYTEDTTAAQTGTAITAGTEVTEGQKLLAGQSVNVTLTLEFTGESLPKDDVTITIGDTTLLYSQDLKSDN